jgi:hypothetical protein
MKTILLAACGSLLWAGTDIWIPLAPDAVSVHALAVAPLIPGTLYAATTGGVFKSTDGRANWAAWGVVNHFPGD